MALDYLEQNCLRANPQPFPELMLIDIHMPVLDGFEFVEKLKKMCVDVFDKTLLCFLSSSTNARDKMRAKTLGVDYYYAKPLVSEHMDELVTTLQRRI
jgi:CheY-like chemotaxis protein